MKSVVNLSHMILNLESQLSHCSACETWFCSGPSQVLWSSPFHLEHSKYLLVLFLCYLYVYLNFAIYVVVVGFFGGLGFHSYLLDICLQEGRVVCEKETCVVECTHPRQDFCCPQCDMCFYEGGLYDNGESFQPDDCKRCLCLVR